MIRWVLNFSTAEIRPEAARLRALLVTILLALALIPSGCAPAGPLPEIPQPAGPPVPPILEGELSRSQTREGAALLVAAQDSLFAGAPSSALEAAERVIRDFPELPGASRALWIQARAHEAMGRPGAASEAAERFLQLLDPAHPLAPPAILLKARNLDEAGSETAALDEILTLPPATPDSTLSQGRDLLRVLVPSLSFRDLDERTRALPAQHPLRGLMATELAVALYLRGDEAEALQWGRAALQEGLEPREERLAEGVVEGRLEEVLGLPVTLGVVLPMTGVSPGLLQYGEWFHEGIQVALEEYREELPRPVRIETVDDGGDPPGARAAIRTLQEADAMAALGFLGQEILSEAARSRNDSMPLFSPFSFLPPKDASAVYSLSGPDLGEALQLARIARELELETVAIVRPGTREAEVNADAFREEFQALGGHVPREIVYDSGGTSFQPQFQEVEEILPDGMFLPLKPGDIQLLAPQITFYGLDTLGVQILGTSSWTDPSVVQEVDSRHTDGVVAATSRLTQDETEAFQRFRESYEALFQKTLRSEVPAFGYDAAALVLEALGNRPRNSEELVAALEGIRDLPGATGILNVEGGRVTREPLLVRIQDHELIYITRRRNQVGIQPD